MKCLSHVIRVLLVVMVLATPVLGVWVDDDYFAREQILVSEVVEHYEDGSTLVIAIYEITVPTKSNLYNKAGRKTYEYRGADGNILWTFAVQGEFRIIEGASVTCTSASCSSAIYNDNWNCSNCCY